MAHDLIALLSAGITLLGLGFVMGFSPTLYAVVFRLLTHASAPARMIRWMTAGLALGATFLVLLFRVVDPDTLTTLLEDRTKTLLVRRSVDLTAGALLLLAGVAQAVRSRRPAKPKKAPSKDQIESPRRMLLVGLANSVIGVSGLATMYMTGRVIRAASTEILLELLLYAVFLTAVVGPYLVVAWAWSAFPRAADRVTDAAAWIARQDLRGAGAVALVLAGLLFLGLGVWGHDVRF